MANTYTQISIHAVFAVKSRENIITKEWRDDLHKYISGIITDEGAKSLACRGVERSCTCFLWLATRAFYLRTIAKNKGK